MKRIILITLSLIMLCGTIAAQQDCPQVDCPGICGRFVDANGDGFCDHGKLSQPKVEAKAEPTTPQQPKAPKPGTGAGTESATSKAASADPKQPAAQENTTANAQTAETETVGADANQSVITQQPEEKAPAKPTSPYHVYLILGGTLLVYLISFILVKTNQWEKTTHRKVWNVALTVTFLVSCLLGLLLAIFIHHGYRPQCYITLLKLHVWFGIAMTIIAVFHSLWHLNYYKSLFKKRKE